MIPEQWDELSLHELTSAADELETVLPRLPAGERGWVQATIGALRGEIAKRAS